ncbi:hypothetical protein CCAX7_25540 [Capsulimonas corticalis]|uniref:cellulase n=1 Tax=Capsulimonas corticalis TaxID=2219043 RepID=A0A402CVR0_9BACT|nr:cellulase family glycosylhydrolase [Capsulimonas corticalis]BDI30503.1 hypothetical protein CCAX7_25540 [Capsulimonas corticalis]
MKTTHLDNNPIAASGKTVILTLTIAAAMAAFGTAAPRAEATPPSLHVSGNRLVDDWGNAVFLKGANLSSLEFTDTPDRLRESAAALLGGNWNARIIRLPISQDRWEGFGVANKAAYRQYVYDIVRAASNANAYVILDLHWSDLGVWGANYDQHNMPDDNTTSAWQDISHDPQLSGNPAVFFGLYNEPHDVSWDIWLSGGLVTTETYQGGSVQYHTPGMQSLVNTVRAQAYAGGPRASDNVLVIAGLDYAYDLTAVANGTHTPQDPGGRGIIYDAHIYPFINNPNKPQYAVTSYWDKFVTVEASHAPIFIGEYGTNDFGESPDGKTFVEGVQNWAASHARSGGFCGTTAWTFNPQGNAGYLITDTYSFNPTQYMGYAVQYFINHGN